MFSIAKTRPLGTVSHTPLGIRTSSSLMSCMTRTVPPGRHIPRVYHYRPLNGVRVHVRTVRRKKDDFTISIICLYLVYTFVSYCIIVTTANPVPWDIWACLRRRAAFLPVAWKSDRRNNNCVRGGSANARFGQHLRKLTMYRGRIMSTLLR